MEKMSSPPSQPRGTMRVDIDTADSSNLPLWVHPIQAATDVSSSHMGRWGPADNDNIQSPSENGQTLEIETPSSDFNDVQKGVPGPVGITFPRRGRQPLHQAVMNQHLFIVEELLRAGADVNAGDEGGSTPLHLASAAGNAAIVSRLLAKGAYIFAQEYEESIQPIHLAAGSGNLEVVNLLLGTGASGDALTVSNRTPLIFAVNMGHTKVVERLLDYTSLVGSADWDEGRQAIHRATSKGCLKIIDLLVSKSADINAVDFAGSTPLILASTYGHFSSVVYLLKKGAKVDAVGGDLRWNALLLAVSRGFERIVRILHSYSANIHATLTPNVTALHLAAQTGHIGTLKFLLQEGVSINAIEDGFGLSALLIAIKEGHEPCADILISHGADIHVTAMDGTNAVWHSCSKFMPNLTLKLLEAGVEPNLAHSVTHHTALHWAAQFGDVASVNSLVAHSANVNALRKGNTTPLAIAASNGHTETVEVLLKAKADVNILDVKFIHAISQAAYGGHLEIVELMLPHIADINVRDFEGVTPLYLAACNGSTEIVSLLVKHGADVNLGHISRGCLPIHEAARYGYLEVVQEIAKADSNVDRKAKSGSTALWYATMNGNHETVNFLLQHDVDVNATKQSTGESVLHRACYLPDDSILKSLLERDPELDQQDNEGRTPLVAAVVHGRRSHVISLILRGANKFSREKSSLLQPIHRAAQYGHLELVKLLLYHGAAVDAVGKNKVTPLWLAAAEGRTEVVRFLLEKGACATNTTLDDLRQPIHGAAEGGHSAIVELLLENGAKHDARTVDGATPLWFAAEQGSNEIVTALLQRNADVNAVFSKANKIIIEEDGSEIEIE